MASADIQNSADFSPTQGGNCTAHPLSAGTDGFVQVGVDPPNLVGDLAFKIGVGSDTYDFDGDPNYTITCDATHPCNLVLKLQVPRRPLDRRTGVQVVPDRLRRERDRPGRADRV